MRKGEAKRSENLTYLFLLFLFLALVFFKELSGQKIIGWGGGDNSLHVLAYRQEVASFLKEQRSLPFWTTLINGGFPLASDPSAGAFYPIDWFFFLVFSSPTALNYSVFFHSFLAALGVYFFLKTLKLPPLASFFGALSFSGSLYFLSLTDNLSILAATSWTPMVFLTFKKAVEKKNFFSSGLAGLVLALQLLAGYPQASLLSLLGVFSFVCYRFFQERKINIFGYFFISVLIGCLISAPQIMLTFRLLPYTPRSKGFLAQALANSLSPLSLASLIFPGLFKGMPVIIGKDLFYFGVPAFVFLVFSFFNLYKSKWEIRFFSLLFLFSLLSAFGKYGLVYYVLGSLPLFNSFRVPEQFLTLTIFSASVLSAYGFSTLIQNLKKDEKRAVKKLKPIFIVAFALIFFAFLFSFALQILQPKIMPIAYQLVEEKIYGQPPHLYPLSYYYSKVEYLYQSFKNRLSPLNPVALMPLLSSLFFLFLLYLTRKKLLNLNLFSKVITLLLILEIASVLLLHQFLPGVDWKIYKRTPETVKFLKKDRSLYRTYSYPSRLKFGLLQEDEQKSRKTEETYVFSFENLLANFPLRYQIPTIQGVEALWFERQEKLLNILESKNKLISERRKINFLEKQAKLLGLLNVKYVISPYPLTSSSFAEVFKSTRSYVYQNKYFLPRAFLVSNYQVLPSDKILSRMIDKKFEPKRLLFLEKNPGIAPDNQKQPAGEVEIEEYQPFYLKIKAQAFNDCFLFLSESFYPGWKAFVDGKETTILRANYLFRAVSLKRGSHQIELVYKPEEVNLAALLSAIGVLSLASCCFKKAISFFKSS